MIALRPPEQVMRLARMGSFHQTRLSFMRAILRRLQQEQWRVERPLWRIDDKGVGVGVYAAHGPNHTYSLICFAHDLPADKRSDRVIAEAWDATFTLFDGIPTEVDLERLAAQVPKQEAGRCSERELVLSRANRSVRLFEHVVDSLANGRQPELAQLEAVGYLMRTTAVYGNGKFGVSDRDRIADRPELAGPFRAELLTVWLIRAFTVDIAEHLAQARAPTKAVRLAPVLRRRLGVGNATGLGMAPFIVNHPVLLNNWIVARETALARVRALAIADERSKSVFQQALQRAKRGVAEWRTIDQRQAQRVCQLAGDLERLSEQVEIGILNQSLPWNALYLWAEENLSLEGQELSVTLVIEPHAALVDDLADTMAADEEAYFHIDGAMPLDSLRQTIEAQYQWALAIDFEQPEQRARFWYVSEEKLEPRLGERFNEPGAELEQRLAFGHDVSALHADLINDSNATVAEFLLRHPQHRHACRRVQTVARLPYADIRDNLISADMLAIDLLRCKLSFFGASKFDPRSDRWVRITMYQDAPFPDELHTLSADDWSYPPLADVG